MYNDFSYGTHPTGPSIQYQVDSPPGVGRQVLVPFELNAAPLPLGGNPVGTRFLDACVAAVQVSNTITMATAAIPWAVARIVGLVTSTTRQGAVTDLIEVQDLSIGGGANLLLATTGQRIEAFDIANEHLAGLRDYPLLRAPNRAFLQIFFRDGTAAGAGALLGNNLITASLVVEVLSDDDFGSHTPGPYARKGVPQRGSKRR